MHLPLGVANQNKDVSRNSLSSGSSFDFFGPLSGHTEPLLPAQSCSLLITQRPAIGEVPSAGSPLAHRLRCEADARFRVIKQTDIHEPPWFDGHTNDGRTLA